MSRHHLSTQVLTNNPLSLESFYCRSVFNPAGHHGKPNHNPHGNGWERARENNPMGTSYLEVEKNNPRARIKT